MYFDLFKEAWITGPLYPKLSIGFALLLIVGLLLFVVFEDKIKL